MADFDWPADLAPSESQFYLQSHTARSESVFTRQAVILGRSAPRWICSLTFRKTETYQAGRMDAMIARLRGGAKSVSLFDWRRPNGAALQSHSAYAAGLPVRYFSAGEKFVGGWGFYVRGRGAPRNLAVSAGGYQIDVQGCAPGTTPRQPGDYIGDGADRCYIVVDYVAADTRGVAKLTVEPAIRAAIAADAATFAQVRAKFRLTSDDAGKNPTDVNRMGGWTLDFVEDLS